MPNKRPNILFILTDQQRPEWVEMNPDISVRTPHLRQLADRGIWLANAICPSPVCAPSRSCLVARAGVRSHSSVGQRHLSP